VSQLKHRRDLDTLDFGKGGGTVNVVVQDARTRAVLMVAHADRDALERSVASGEMHFRSRTRGLWHKGATSGNVQRVEALYADCDGDTVLALVDAAGPACHTGDVTCFAQPSGEDILDELDSTIRERAESSESRSYTQRLLEDRNLRLKKLGEEAAELVLACADESRERAVNEGADVIYHTLVALRALDLGLSDVRAVLRDRRR
jgi:phosphoribosyl-AMP cyclohydrolase / phosphoribosyl-ATP pyrophosphohydrolase